MAIVSLPADVSQEERVTCAICTRRVKFFEATAGLQGLDNTQAFACNQHFQSGAQYILGWTDFILAQRQIAAKPTDTKITSVRRYARAIR
jgi:hypothetical protein